MRIVLKRGAVAALAVAVLILGYREIQRHDERAWVEGFEFCRLGNRTVPDFSCPDGWSSCFAYRAPDGTLRTVRTSADLARRNPAKDLVWPVSARDGGR